MNITPEIEIRGLGLFLKKFNAIVFSDVHLGFEESQKNIHLPLFQWEDVIKELEKILHNEKFEMIIINGDLKEEFGRINKEEWRHTTQFLELCLEHAKKVVIIKGNHDALLGPVAQKKKIKLLPHLILDDLLICHGNEKMEIQKKIKTIIIGHEHPAVTLHDGVRTEKFKCFLKGSYEKRMLIVLPSLFAINEGTDILQSKPLSPFLQQDLSRFDCFIAADTIYEFGKLKKLQ